MKRTWLLAASLALVTLTGCYVATIETGRAKLSKTISKPWASCWIYGLVPPTTIQTSADCPDGVAVVQTQHSFLNYLVGGLTFGIYTPIQIVVTCAEGGASGYVSPEDEIVVPRGASSDVVRDALGRAAQRTVESGNPVLVRFGG